MWKPNWVSTTPLTSPDLQRRRPPPRRVDHLALREVVQVASLRGAAVLRVLLGEFGEVAPGLHLLHDVVDLRAGFLLLRVGGALRRPSPGRGWRATIRAAGTARGSCRRSPSRPGLDTLTWGVTSASIILSIASCFFSSSRTFSGVRLRDASGLLELVLARELLTELGDAAVDARHRAPPPCGSSTPAGARGPSRAGRAPRGRPGRVPRRAPAGRPGLRPT